MLFIITGHGAKDPGACGNGFHEAERVRALAQRMKLFGGDSVLVSEPERNYYKDNGISKLTLPKGTKIIELHMDSGKTPEPKGAHVIINGKFSADEYDKRLAEYISGVFPGRSQKIVGRTNLANVNRAAAKGYNYRLLECGFITNAGDVKIFNDRMDEVAKGILSCFGIGVNKSVAQPTSQPVPRPALTQQLPTGIIFTYAVIIEGGRVLPEVCNLEDFAGIKGKRITDVAIKVNIGTIKYQVHVLGGGWLPWVTGYNWNDQNNGYAGNGRPIDAIRIYYETPADYAAKHGYKKAQYHVSPLNKEYYSWQYDNETTNGQDGYAGCFGKAIDRFQLW